MDISALYKCFTECGKVTTDSRNCPEGSMFIALKGETFNGNAYALQALEKGCQYAVVDEKEYAADGHPISMMEAPSSIIWEVRLIISFSVCCRLPA